MPMPFDATLKDLVQSFLHDYEVQMGLSEFAPLTPLNVDLSTVTAATDVALGHGDPPRRVVDINFQSGPDESLEARILLYNAPAVLPLWRAGTQRGAAAAPGRGPCPADGQTPLRGPAAQG